ncbi:MAG: ribulose 1,5-bisphosphate carboxylase large subunit [Nitrospira sp. WS110]|nr:ribulose 1,5-bisphosphate carboxylase large subunit [Nitrospira sp. WS110]
MDDRSSDLAEFMTAIYEVDGPEPRARATAEGICFDQTIEAEKDLLPPLLQSVILGHLDGLRPISGGRYEATIRYRGELIGADCSDLLNILYGTSSLRGDVKLLSFTITNERLSFWRGPRFGIDGLRKAVGAVGRPLLCGVLKPLGRSPQELAHLAAQFVEGGVDVIKDDQGLVDQRWAPFEERVARCADAIGRASQRRGRPCLYLAHVSGAWDVMRRRAIYAKTVGATGLLIAPGLTGFDSLRTLCVDDALMLPVACHPALLGAAVGDCRSGLAPAALYGLLPRLAGADITIYPAFGSDFLMSQPECMSVAASCRQSWGQLRSTMPAVGGRIGAERLTELGTLLGCDTIFVLGSRLQKDPDGMAQAIQPLYRVLANSFR